MKTHVISKQGGQTEFKTHAGTAAQVAAADIAKDFPYRWGRFAWCAWSYRVSEYSYAWGHPWATIRFRRLVGRIFWASR